MVLFRLIVKSLLVTHVHYSKYITQKNNIAKWAMHAILPHYTANMSGCSSATATLLGRCAFIENKRILNTPALRKDDCHAPGFSQSFVLKAVQSSADTRQKKILSGIVKLETLRFEIVSGLHQTDGLEISSANC